jgi:hypothetical protein
MSGFGVIRSFRKPDPLFRRLSVQCSLLPRACSKRYLTLTRFLFQHKFPASGNGGFILELWRIFILTESEKWMRISGKL